MTLPHPHQVKLYCRDRLILLVWTPNPVLKRDLPGLSKAPHPSTDLQPQPSTRSLGIPPRSKDPHPRSEFPTPIRSSSTQVRRPPPQVGSLHRGPNSSLPIQGSPPQVRSLTPGPETLTESQIPLQRFEFPSPHPHPPPQVRRPPPKVRSLHSGPNSPHPIPMFHPRSEGPRRESCPIRRGSGSGRRSHLYRGGAPGTGPAPVRRRQRGGQPQPPEKPREDGGDGGGAAGIRRALPVADAGCGGRGTGRCAGRGR